MKTVTIGDFLTTEQINQCIDIFKDSSVASLAREFHDKIVQPNIAEINRKLGQENDPMYLAYMIEYAINRCATVKR